MQNGWGTAKAVLGTGVVGLMLAGCTADSGWKVAYEQERTTRQEQDSRIRNLEAQQRQPPQTQQTPQPQQAPPVQQPPAQRKVTIAEVVEKCAKLQAERTLPIGCWTGVTDKKVPYIYFKFVNADAMKLYWDKLVEYFIVDFCDRYNEANQGAGIGAELADPHVVRMMHCATGQMSEWVKVDEKTSSNRY